MSIAFNSFSQVSLDSVRDCYLSTEHGEEEILRLINLTSTDTASPIVRGYNNAAKLMLLDYEGNPIEKYKSFKKNTTELDELINDNPSNIELRLLRYSIQLMAPFFLKYDHSLSLDYHFIVAKINSQPPKVKQFCNHILKQLTHARERHPRKY